MKNIRTFCCVVLWVLYNAADVNGSGSIPAKLALEDAAHITGQVVDDAGTPVTNIVISVYKHSDGLLVAYRSATLATDGTFDFHVEGGNYSLSFAEEELDLLRLYYDGMGVTIENGQSTNVTVRVIRANGEVSGYVRDPQNGMPLAGVQVSADSSANGGQWFISRHTDEQGFYRLRVFPGTWHVNVNSGHLLTFGYRPVNSITVQLNNFIATRIFDVYRFPAFISGRALDENDNPLSWLNIYAEFENGRIDYGFTDEEGNFLIGAENGSWTIGISFYDAYLQKLIVHPFSFAITNNVSASNLVVRASKGPFVISGTIVDTEGMPVFDLEVIATMSSQGTNFTTLTRTEFDGTYSLPSFNGTWVLEPNCFSLRERGYSCISNANVIVSNSNTTANFTVELIPPPTITSTNFPIGQLGVPYNFRVLAIGGMPPYSWSQGPDGEPPPGMNIYGEGELSGTPENAGTYTFTIGVWDADYRYTQKTITVQIGVPPQPPSLSTPQKNGPEFSFMVNNAVEARHYEVWWSTNMTTWTVLHRTNSPSTSFRVTDTETTNSWLFYRVQ